MFKKKKNILLLLIFLFLIENVPFWQKALLAYQADYYTEVFEDAAQKWGYVWRYDTNGYKFVKWDDYKTKDLPPANTPVRWKLDWSNPPSGVTETTVISELKKAFQKWNTYAEGTNFKFAHESDKNKDTEIVVKWVSGRDRGWYNPKSPLPHNLCLNKDVLQWRTDRWNIIDPNKVNKKENGKNPNYYDIYTIAVHEIGHYVGLAHPTDNDPNSSPTSPPPIMITTDIAVGGYNNTAWWTESSSPPPGETYPSGYKYFKDPRNVGCWDSSGKLRDEVIMVQTLYAIPDGKITSKVTPIDSQWKYTYTVTNSSLACSDYYISALRFPTNGPITDYGGRLYRNRQWHDITSDIKVNNSYMEWSTDNPEWMIHKPSGYHLLTPASKGEFWFTSSIYPVKGTAWETFSSPVTQSFSDFTVANSNLDVPAPEPSTMLLLGAGLAGLAGIARRKKKVQI